MNLEYPLSDNYHAYTNYEIIKTKEHKILVFGWNPSENQFGGLIIHKVRTNEQFRPLSQLVRQIGPFTTYQELQRQACHFFKHAYTQKQKIIASGIIGFHRFLQGYYLMYIKQFERVAKIGRHKISEIKKTGIINLFDMHNNETKANEQRYFEILSEYSLENYYYSCTYDLTNTLGKNMLRNSLPFFQNSEIKPQQENSTFFSKDPNVNAIAEIFHFNYGVIKEFNDFVSNKKWILSIIHGFCKHLNTKVKGTIFNIIIIARRCRHHAGTRYIKRGMDSQGFVANYVEVEQIAINFSLSQDTRPVCSSFVQVRGSVPTYWMQKPSIRIPKPAIQIKKDDFMFLGTRKHFHDLVGRYGQHIYCINLMKKKQKTVRQGALSQQYQTGVSFINKQDLKREDSIHYIQIDMKYNLKQDKKMFISKIRTLAYYTIQKTGMFLCMNSSRSNFQQSLEFQNGVIRANCVDCLDRTNSFQQLVGEVALSIQLNRLMKEHIKLQNLQLDELQQFYLLRTHSMYSKLYEEMGDLISIQYGSSLAHKQKIQQTTQKRIQFWTSIQRHWNNNLKDYDRQQQIDIFLGYKPDPQGPQIWNIKPSIDHFPDKSLQIYEKASYKYEKYVDWFDEAIKHFRKTFYLEIIDSIDQNKKSNKHKIEFEQMQPIGKQLLLSKFSAQSVSNLIIENESTQILMFRIKPNLKLEKRVWRAMNPKPRKMETLQQKLSYCYHKMDFLKNQQLEFQMKYSPLKNAKNQSSNSFTLKSISKLPEFNQKSGSSIFGASNTSKRSPKKTVSLYGLVDEDIEFKDDLKRYLILKHNYDLDLEDEMTVQSYLNSEMLKDSEIYKQIEDNFEGCSNVYYNYIGQNSNENSLDMFKSYTDIKDTVVNSLQNDNELKKIQMKISSRNYIFFQQPPIIRTKADQIESSGKIPQNNKKQLNKQNKILALEKALSKNFTQGPYKMKFLEI